MPLISLFVLFPATCPKCGYQFYYRGKPLVVKAPSGGVCIELTCPKCGHRFKVFYRFRRR